MIWNTTERAVKLESSIEEEEDWDQPYKVTVQYAQLGVRKQMFEWCNERFGRHSKQWNNPRWSSNTGHYSFWFARDRDRTMFLMRWS